MPLFGVLLYFNISPKFYIYQVINIKLLALILLTIVLPILTFFLLKSLKIINSLELHTPRERFFPLLINGVILLIILKRVFPITEIIELYYFFLGILIAVTLCLITVLFQIKASIHMMFISGVLCFMILMSQHFKVNINIGIAFFCIILGAVATSRLHLKAHTFLELSFGICIGAIPQLIVFNYL